MHIPFHGFKGSGVQRLYSHHHTPFCKRFVGENRPLPHPHKSGTWHLAMMWQNPHFLWGFQGSNFILFFNPEPWTSEPVNAYKFFTIPFPGTGFNPPWRAIWPVCPTFVLSSFRVFVISLVFFVCCTIWRVTAQIAPFYNLAGKLLRLSILNCRTLSIKRLRSKSTELWTFEPWTFEPINPTTGAGSAYKSCSRI